MKPLPFPRRHHMLRQQELAKSVILQTVCLRCSKMTWRKKRGCANLPATEALQNLENNQRLLGVQCWVEGGGTVSPVQMCYWCPLKTPSQWAPLRQDKHCCFYFKAHQTFASRDSAITGCSNCGAAHKGLGWGVMAPLLHFGTDRPYFSAISSGTGLHLVWWKGTRCGNTKRTLELSR